MLQLVERFPDAQNFHRTVVWQWNERLLNIKPNGLNLRNVKVNNGIIIIIQLDAKKIPEIDTLVSKVQNYIIVMTSIPS